MPRASACSSVRPKYETSGDVHIADIVHAINGEPVSGAEHAADLIPAPSIGHDT